MGGEDYSRSHWQPDDSRKDCAKCKSGFTFTNRRHHCRNCGGLFCNNCSSKTSTVPRRNINVSVRVCDTCYTSINSAAEPVKPANTVNTHTPSNVQSPARVEPIPQQTIAPSSDVVPQIPLANAYGIIKEQAGKAYLDVAVAAVQEVVNDESQCSEQQYEFDAAGKLVLALPRPTTSDVSAIVNLLLGERSITEVMNAEEKRRSEEALRQLSNIQFPSLFVALGDVQSA